MECKPGHRLILCNDGGSLVGPTVEAPMGPEGLARLVIDPLKGTQIDTLFWQLGTDPYLGTPTHRLTDQYSHDTAVGPRWGQGNVRFSTAANWRIYENTRHMRELGADPAAVVVEHGQRAGLGVFLSMRVNDVHDINLETGLSDPLMSPMKRGHPDWLIGGDGPARTAYNFAVGEVCDYKLSLALEAIANYDLDGLDWDYCRSPSFFPDGVGQQHSHVMTDLMRQLRVAVNAKARQVGKPVCLSARIPGSLDDAHAKGLDVRAWIAEGLMDIVIVGHARANKHRLPVEEYVDAARGTDIHVVAQNLGLFMQPRPLSARLLWNERDYYSTEMCRATAATHWCAGAHGIYLFNNHLIPYVRNLDYDRRPWMEIGDPDLIARKDKHYVVDDRSWGEGPLPLTLGEIGDEVAVAVDVADELAAAADDGELQDVTVRVLIEHLTDLDNLCFELNEYRLDVSQATRRLLYNDAWLDFEVRPPVIRKGWNHLRVSVAARNHAVVGPLVLSSVEVIVRYRASPDELARNS